MIKLTNLFKLLFFILIIPNCSLETSLPKKCSVSMMSPKQVPNEIKKIYIECDTSSYNSIYENFKTNENIPVKISYDNTVWCDVKMRIRGDSSRELPKKSLKLTFSEETPFFNGKTKINLNAEWYDKTYISQYLSSYLMRLNNVSCFTSEHVFIYLNGKPYGIFLMVENIDSEFLVANNFSKTGNLYKASKDGACFNDTSEVPYLWEKKTNKKDSSRIDLKEIIFNLNATSINEAYDLYNQTFYYDKLISQVALNILLGNKSTYYHNYYMFHDKDSNKWDMFPWDMDKTLHRDFLNLHYTRSTWSEGINSNLPDNPIPELIFTNKKMKEDLYNRLNQIINNSFNTQFLLPIIDSLSSILKDYIELDELDNIINLKDWETETTNLISFIDNRPQIIFNQIRSFPSSFLVNKSSGLLISWSPAESQSRVLYSLKLCKDFNFKNDSIYSFQTSKNHILINDLPSGSYYYFVTAANKRGETTGFRIKNKLIVK